MSLSCLFGISFQLGLDPIFGQMKTLDTKLLTRCLVTEHSAVAKECHAGLFSLLSPFIGARCLLFTLEKLRRTPVSYKPAMP
jgi:hypothetical protein